MPSFEIPFFSDFILMFSCSILRCHSCQVWYWCVCSHLWHGIIVRFDIDVFIPSFEMSFLSGLILMFLCPLLRCHSCQVWYWCAYALFWDAILSGLILMCLCSLLRCNYCQVLYWCLYFLFWDAILVNMSYSSRLLVPLFVWGRLHTGPSQEKRKEASPIP